MKFRATPVLLLLAAALGSCEMNKQALNPPAEGFDLANSDPKAVELADSIMNAMGGRRNWDKTRYISWNFFGARNLTWDKKDNRVRIEYLKDSVVYLVDLDKQQGRVSVKGQEITEPDSLTKMLTKGKSMWINDSYWLLMPFKLKDTGLAIKYIGEDTMRTGTKCNVMELTFKDIGDTPQNKYRIFVDANDNLVKQWSYYSNSNQDSANFTRPWDNYQKYGDILISADRSDGAGPKNVKVDDTLPDKVFTEF
ncbi:MAG TPA: hypothetical protein VK589_20545 [Chryseolinea sp.]|nr:hypothetical protein [Chryseolinea sp.]